MTSGSVHKVDRAGVVATGDARLRREMPQILEDAGNGLPVLAREVLAGLRAGAIMLPPSA
jgi:hypothetical protein